MYLGAGYDGVQLLYQALRTCGEKDSQCVRRKLVESPAYEGANGRISFDAKGNNQELGAVEIRVLDQGRFAVFGGQK